MRRIRFHIGSLLILVLFLAVGFAALREANDLWDGIVLSLTIAALMSSVPLAIHRRADRRAFWLGFALFGSSYLALSAIPAIGPRLLTTTALTYLDSRLPGRPVVITGQAWGPAGSQPTQVFTTVAFSPQGNMATSTANTGAVRLWTVNPFLGAGGGTTENFLRIGHSLCALILAGLGGLLSRSLHRRDRAPDGPQPMPSCISPN